MSHCRIHPEAPPLDMVMAAALARIPTAILSDQLDRTGGLLGIAPVGQLPAGAVVVGRALTVRTRPGDNLVVHKAADLAVPGDFLVIDAGGGTDRAVIGDIYCSYAASRGVVAVAVDGLVRDVAELRHAPMPVFARGFTHVGPHKDGPGEIRSTIAAGGTAVHCGDYVVGDADGVVVIPRSRVADVLEKAKARAATEARMLEDIRAGTLERTWVDAALEIEFVTEE